MSEYSAPLRDMDFVLRELTALDSIPPLDGNEPLTLELATMILGAAAEFATGVLSPLNPVGDRVGAICTFGQVNTAPGWKEAYKQFCEGGWPGLPESPEHGGQGLPSVLATLVEEMWNGANVAFTLCPMLTRGAIHALEARGSEALKETWLPRLVSGEWTGTMNLTEPQAGSDLAAIRTRAEPDPDGSWRVRGQKIFITYGEHDLTDNIVHLVLARTPDAPPGVKGLSLFLVPKFLIDSNGGRGDRNDVSCVSIEHKLGIHGSPTAVLAFGDEIGAKGWLVGDLHRGVEIMFLMMNSARFAIGLEGLGLSERAYQRAVDYAKNRIQGTETGSSSPDKVAIIRHPDVRRMLMSMRSRIEAMRALSVAVAASMDLAQRGVAAETRAAHQAFVDLMIPVVKAWNTENSIDIASLGIQVHGGVGFVEETGAAQHFRDARITTIYEGTTGIQAADLVGRKVARDGGRAIGAVLESIGEVAAALAATDSGDAVRLATALNEGRRAVEDAVAFILDHFQREPARVLAGAVPFLELFGIVCGGWQMGRAALACLRHRDAGTAEAFHTAKLKTARFYAEHYLSRAESLATIVRHGADATLALAEDSY